MIQSSRRFSWSAFSLACLLVSASAEVTPVTLGTGRGEGNPNDYPSSYVVPEGKVLIVESVQYQNIGGSRGIPDELVVQISEVFDNSTARHLVYIDLGENRAYQQHKFDPPLRLKAGSYLGSNRIEGFYIWRGLLVDPSELFAQLDIELEKPAVEGGQMVAKAKVSSPRPARVEIESSENMEEFVAESSAAVVRLTEPGEFEAKVATNGAEQKFIKATAKVRP